ASTWILDRVQDDEEGRLRRGTFGFPLFMKSKDLCEAKILDRVQDDREESNQWDSTRADARNLRRLVRSDGNERE
ncbi:MAG TPA: hypothetical protein VGO08_13425, partial [Burkholderiales bacterium]|nr:hypothetical protein [Burkholderiales bacterium]